MNDLFHWGGLRNHPLETWNSTELFKITSTHLYTLRVANTLKYDPLWNCNPEEVHRFWQAAATSEEQGVPLSLSGGPGLRNSGGDFSECCSKYQGKWSRRAGQTSYCPQPWYPESRFSHCQEIATLAVLLHLLCVCVPG